VDSPETLREDFPKQKIHSGEIVMTILRIAAFIFAALFTGSVAQAEIKTQWIEYTHGDAKLKGYLAYDDAVTGKRPAILMIHDRAGMQPYALKHAETYAKLGYVTFVADFFGYGQGILPKDVPEAVVQMGIYTKDRALMKTRAQAGYDVLVKNPMVDATKVALVGYCFGGMVGVDFGSTGVPLGAIVAIHGSFDGHPPGWAQNVKGKFLILHGAEDKPYPLEKVAAEVYNELRKANVEFQMEFYSGAGHGFSVPKNKAEEVANAQSIVATDRFLKTAFAQ
jgi:dienelactone hydrolase